MIYRTLVTLLFAVVVVMGCTQASFRQSDVRSFQTLDEMFYEVARLAPDFGGAFYDAKGRMTINLVPAREGMQEAQRRRVLDALAQVFGKSFLRPAHSPSRDPAAQSELVFLPAKYGYGELFEHYTTINPVYRLKGVLYTDIDERANRITIGVSNLEEYRSLIASILSDQSVPTDMVDVIEGDIMYNLWSGSVAAEQRPTVGGIEIANPNGNRCTLGINVIHPDSSNPKLGFITNSHCTLATGILGLDVFVQPSDGEVIGVEFQDPPLTASTDCPDEVVACRWSDAALVLYEMPQMIASRVIARTINANGNFSIDPDAQVFPVVGESPWILVGDEAQKVGAGSGWTRAAVTNACVFFRPGDAPSTAFLCQYAAQSIDGEPIAGPGDSGAPVFFLAS